MNSPAMNTRRLSLALVALGSTFAFACGGSTPPPEPKTTAAQPPALPTPSQAPTATQPERLSRADFNRLAAELALPLFWVEDTNKDGALDSDELAVYWGLVPGEARRLRASRTAPTLRASASRRS